MGQGHALGGVGNEVAGNQTVLHSDVAHRDAVADRDGREDNGHAAGFGDAQLDGLRNLVDIHVAGNDFVEA